jgi:hypothetical protein
LLRSKGIIIEDAMKNPKKKEIKKLLEENNQKDGERELKKKTLEMLETNKNSKKQKIKIELNKEGIKVAVGRFANKINKMLNENVNDSIEIGTKKVGNTKIDYGIRMRFLDDKKKEKAYLRKKRID